VNVFVVKANSLESEVVPHVLKKIAGLAGQDFDMLEGESVGFLNSLGKTVYHLLSCHSFNKPCVRRMRSAKLRVAARSPLAGIQPISLLS
jgi:hypothetical protein